MKNSKEKIKAVSIVVAVLLVLSVVFFAINQWDIQRVFTPNDDYIDASSKIVEYQGKKYCLNENIETVLLIGIDKFEQEIDTTSYYNDQQADFLMLLIVDNANRSCTPIHINRDSIAPVNVLGVAGQTIETREMQIALSHAYGNGDVVSMRNTADSVSALLGGVNIDYTVCATMDAVSVLNDLVSGVTITVMDDFPYEGKVYEQGDELTLNGEQALGYVRSRGQMEDKSNLRRMERQKQYINALYEQVLNAKEKDENFFNNAMKKLSGYIVSDAHTVDLLQFADDLSTYHLNDICSLKGESMVGEQFMEYYIDRDAVKSMIIELLYNEAE